MVIAIGDIDDDPDIGGISPSEKGAPNGVCPLDGAAVIPLIHIPPSIADGLKYQGTWDASTNTPALANTDTGVTGNLYRCNVAGSVDFGAGSIAFTVGDFVANNGTIWEKWDAGDVVASVFGRVGAIVAVFGDYDASLIDNDSDVPGANVKLALESLLELDGSKAMTGDLNMGGNDVTNAASVQGPAASDAGIEAGAGFDAYSKIGDNAGANAHEFRDSDDAVVGKVDSNGNMTLEGMTASLIVETDGAKKLVSIAKQTAYNKPYGTGASQTCEGNDGRLVESAARAAELNRYQADVACAGVTPVQTDFTAWAVGDRGIGVGSGGRIFLVYKDGATSIKSIELV